MKLTKSTLKQLIKEELRKVLQEQEEAGCFECLNAIYMKTQKVNGFTMRIAYSARTKMKAICAGASAPRGPSCTCASLKTHKNCQGK